MLRPTIKRGNAYELKARAEFLKGLSVFGAKPPKEPYKKTNAYLDKAISDSKKAIEVNPKSAEAYYRRGMAYECKAFSEFFKSFPFKLIDPKSAEALTYTDKAISDFNKAIELNPEYPEAYAYRGPLYSLKGQSDRAKADRNKAMERFYWRAISYELKGQYEKACIDYRTACLGLGSKAACGEFDILEEKSFCWVDWEAKPFCGDEKALFHHWLYKAVIKMSGH